MTDDFAALSVDELLELLAAGEPVPGSGTAAALVLAMAASLVAKAARRTPEWDGATGAAAQAVSLRQRALALAAADAEAYREALDWLGRRDGKDHLLAAALDRAADVPLQICRAAADVALLAHDVAERCDQAVRADVVGAATLAAGVAQATARLVEVNLVAGEGDLRAREANACVEAALGSARG